MELASIAALIAILIALIFDFTNGFHDAANQVATVITSNALSPAKALMIAAFGDFIGAYFLGTAVAETLGKDIVDPSFLSNGISGVLVIIAALIGATVWNLITWKFGMPSSSSHALIGGLVGAFIVGWGIDLIHWSKVLNIILIMLISPLVGLIATYIFTVITLNVSKWLTPKANRIFEKLQVLSSTAQALAHGTNDAQKTMGVIVFILIILGLYVPPIGGKLIIPGWVILVCASAISLGTLSGGRRIIKTLGAGLYKVRAIHGFASQTASSIIIYLTALFGYPISTTQVISSSIMGAGAATRPKMVRWKVAQDMAVAWLITIPVSAFIAALTLTLLKAIF